MIHKTTLIMLAITSLPWLGGEKHNPLRFKTDERRICHIVQTVVPAAPPTQLVFTLPLSTFSLPSINIPLPFWKPGKPMRIEPRVECADITIMSIDREEYEDIGRQDRIKCYIAMVAMMALIIMVRKHDPVSYFTLLRV